jgi:autophagy-related protein 27
MVRRRPPAYSCPFSFILFFLIPFVRAQDPFDCHVEVGNVKYDLTALAGEHTLQRTRVTPPSTMIDTLRFDLCADLKLLDGVKEGDQVRARRHLSQVIYIDLRNVQKCPTGTRACLTKTNRKQDETDRITVVIPIAQSALKPNVASLLSPKGLSIIMHGADYPSSSPTPHFLNVTLLCSPDDTGDPSFTEYHKGQAKVEWRVPAACASEGPSDDDRSGGGGGENKKEERVGSGMGWFFLV